MGVRGRLFGEGAKLCCERYLTPPFAGGVKYGSMVHRTRQHFFKTKRLGAKLNIIVIELPPLALLIFDWDKRATGMLLDDVAFSVETKALGPDRESAEQRDTLGDFEAGQICVFVGEIAEEGVDIRSAHSLDDFQPRPPRAKEEVVEKRERERLDRLNFGG